MRIFLIVVLGPTFIFFKEISYVVLIGVILSVVFIIIEHLYDKLITHESTKNRREEWNNTINIIKS